MAKKIKDIDKIARDYANKEYPPMFEMPDDNWKQRAGYVKGFKTGVEWQKNHVWHKADDDPPINWKEVLIEYGNYYHDVGFYYKDSNTFQLRIDEAVRMEDVERWAYLEDLGAL